MGAKDTIMINVLGCGPSSGVGGYPIGDLQNGDNPIGISDWIPQCTESEGFGYVAIAYFVVRKLSLVLVQVQALSSRPKPSRSVAYALRLF